MYIYICIIVYNYISLYKIGISSHTYSGIPGLLPCIPNLRFKDSLPLFTVLAALGKLVNVLTALFEVIIESRFKVIPESRFKVNADLGADFADRRPPLRNPCSFSCAA